MHPSTKDNIDPVRQLDIAGIPNLFDHSGNYINGHLGAHAVIAGWIILETAAHKEVKHPVACAAVATAAATDVNYAYEAGVPMIYREPPGSTVDMADVAFGSVGGLVLSVAYCMAALRHRRNRRAANSRLTLGHR